MNNNFFDRPPEERAVAMDAACDRNEVADFFDLPAEERALVYEGGDYSEYDEWEGRC